MTGNTESIGSRDPKKKTFVLRRDLATGYAVNVLVQHGSAKNQHDLGLYRKWRNHSIGFEWGYGGSGPAQLALAMLANVTGNIPFALQYYQEFKRDVIARLPRDAETIRIEEDEVWAWVGRQPVRDRAPALPEEERKQHQEETEAEELKARGFRRGTF